MERHLHPQGKQHKYKCLVAIAELLLAEGFMHLRQFFLFLLFASIVHFIFSAQEIQTNNIPQSDSDGWEC